MLPSCRIREALGTASRPRAGGYVACWCYHDYMSSTPATPPADRLPAPGDRVPIGIGIRELRQHASVYVDLAEKGHTVDITNRGRLVARLVPAGDTGSPLERLVAAGIILPAEEPGNLLDIEPAPPVPAGQRTGSEILLQMREEERY
jgi:prevent-host-death family protein